MNNLFLNRYPYTDFHELNLSWLIQVITEVQKTLEDFVAINALKYADPIQWNITTQYEKNTIVIDPVSGVAYISVQPVPSGVALTNTDYWTVVFDLGQFVVRASKNFSINYEVDTTTSATFASNAGDWLVWGDTLYIATQPEYRSFLLPLVKYAVELDKTNESGLCGKFILAQAEAEAMSAYSQGDVETAVQKYLTAANNEFVRAEEKQECFFTAAYLVAYSDTDDYEGIISYLKTAYELAPESSKAQAIQDAITYFETVLEKTGQRSAE